jgi:cytochrome c oxidase cbb3-type subunit III
MQQSLRMGVALFVLLAAQTAFAEDKAAIQAGSEVYATNCSPCHGERLANSGGVPDLRNLGQGDKAKFDAVVTDGKGGQMPPWDGILTQEQIGQVWAYIRSVAD